MLRLRLALSKAPCKSRYFTSMDWNEGKKCFANPPCLTWKEQEEIGLSMFNLATLTGWAPNLAQSKLDLAIWFNFVRRRSCEEREKEVWWDKVKLEKWPPVKCGRFVATNGRIKWACEDGENDWPAAVPWQADNYTEHWNWTPMPVNIKWTSNVLFTHLQHCTLLNNLLQHRVQDVLRPTFDIGCRIDIAAANRTSVLSWHHIQCHMPILCRIHLCADMENSHLSELFQPYPARSQAKRWKSLQRPNEKVDEGPTRKATERMDRNHT